MVSAGFLSYANDASLSNFFHWNVSNSEGIRRNTPRRKNMGNFTMWPGGIIAWLVVGLISGWAAGSFMKGGGFGMLGDIAVGLIGAAIGGFLFSFFMAGPIGFWGSIVVSFVGACLFIYLLRLFR